ncbi:MAG: YhcH/YjgK/YiaL family protein [Paludibacter sp.]|jgi:YhcH/YjgK/YiaL family protein|nr:YhcH/YjgK/YiaL family protein [Paludibacter sp.]
MKHTFIFSVIIAAFLCASCQNKKEQAWFDSGEWRQGFKPELANPLNAKLFYEQYHKNPELWKIAFEFLQQDLAAIPAASYDLAGGINANITEYNTKAMKNGSWEAHRRVVDIHYVISGKENIGFKPLVDCALPNEYVAEKDKITFDVQDGTFKIGNQGNFFIFFPETAHCPSMKIDTAEFVKKIVIKIPFN